MFFFFFFKNTPNIYALLLLASNGYSEIPPYFSFCFQLLLPQALLVTFALFFSVRVYPFKKDSLALEVQRLIRVHFLVLGRPFILNFDQVQMNLSTLSTNSALMRSKEVHG